VLCFVSGFQVLFPLSLSAACGIFKRCIRCESFVFKYSEVVRSPELVAQCQVANSDVRRCVQRVVRKWSLASSGEKRARRTEFKARALLCFSDTGWET
jgi:hypothetical protein